MSMLYSYAWLFRFKEFEELALEERIKDRDLAHHIKEYGLDDRAHKWPYPRPTDSLQVRQKNLTRAVTCCYFHIVIWQLWLEIPCKQTIWHLTLIRCYSVLLFLYYQIVTVSNRCMNVGT